MRTRALVLAACAALVLAACKKRTPATDAGGARVGRAPSRDAAPGTAPGLTGAVSEEEFKAMHQLKTGAPAARRGTMIEVEGTRAYLSLPPNAKAPLPGVVVIQEWWGLNDNILLWSDRLAAAGYAALAVDLYDGQVATTPGEAMKLMKALDPAKALTKLRAAAKLLADDPRVKAPKRGAIGWCLGGTYALELALHEPLDATVMYYGRAVTDVAALKKMRGPLLGIFGNRDKSIPPAAVDRFEAALKEAGVAHRLLRYDADHAFGNPSNPHYDQKAGADAWAKVQAFFAEHLKPSR